MKLILEHNVHSSAAKYTAGQQYDIVKAEFDRIAPFADYEKMLEAGIDTAAAQIVKINFINAGGRDI